MTSADDLPVERVVALVKRGDAVACPRCGVRLQTMPEDWVEGELLGLIKCPTSESHYSIYIEDADAMRRIRDVIRTFRRKDD